MHCLVHSIPVLGSAVARLGEQHMSMENAKTLVCHYFHRLLNEHDVSVCDEFLAPEYIDHDAPSDTPPGPSSTKAFVTKFIDEYPDIGVQIADIVAEADKVAARIIWQGTHRQSGTKLHQMGVVILRMNEQGQIAERWSAYTNFTD